MKEIIDARRDFGNDVDLVELRTLIEHEETNKEHLEKLKKEIKSDKMLKIAVAVDKSTNVVLDGHHRLQVLKELGYRKIPVKFVDYQSPEIQVQARRVNWKLSKEIVLNAALSGRKLPPKASKHMVTVNGRLKHISAIEKEVNLPLDKLK